MSTRQQDQLDATWHPDRPSRAMYAERLVRSQSSMTPYSKIKEQPAIVIMDEPLCGTCLQPPSFRKTGDSLGRPVNCEHATPLKCDCVQRPINIPGYVANAALRLWSMDCCHMRQRGGFKRSIVSFQNSLMILLLGLGTASRCSCLLYK